VPPLAQQELLEVPPSRRIIVPPGHGHAHWGADVSVSRLSLAFVTSEGARAARTTLFRDLDGGARLAHIWAETGGFVEELFRDGWPLPGLIWVEQPSGARPNPNLSYACGVIIGSLHDAIERVTGRTIMVTTVPSATWKLKATGFGRHDKPTKKKLGRSPVFEDYGIARWAKLNGYTGSSWDESDALGIAEAARRTVALEAR
jgi:hypothetical protein